MSHKLFTRDGCVPCEAVKKFLVSKDIMYETVDTTNNPGLLKEVSAISGVYTTPQLLTTDGQVIVGVNYGKMSQL